MLVKGVSTNAAYFLSVIINSDGVNLVSILLSVILAVCGHGSCGPHGTCLTIGEAYSFYTDTTGKTNYTGWEASHATTCMCETGWTGATCELRK